MTVYGFKKNKCKEEVYTKEEVENLIEERTNDSGWVTAELETTNFKVYDNIDIGECPPQYRKIGKTIEIRGVVSPASDDIGFDQEDGNKKILVFNLPEGFRPSYELNCICQGSGISMFLLTICSTGEVFISRYRKLNNDDTGPNTLTWLPFHDTFFID